MKDPCVSVVIPAYNRELFLGDCIDSVLRQTYATTEIIVVDDCSTDNTVQLLHRYGARVRVIQLERNAGAPAARNRGIREATGELIAFLDSDDYWSPNKVEVFVQSYRMFPQNHFLISDFNRFAYAQQQFYALSSSQIFNSIYPLIQDQMYSTVKAFSIASLHFFHLLLSGYPPFSSAIMVTKDLCTKIQGWNETLANNQDFDFALRCVQNSAVTYIDQQLSTVVRHDSNLSSNLLKQAIGGVTVIETNLKATSPANSDIRQMLRRAMARRLCGMGHNYRSRGMYRDACRVYLRSLAYPEMRIHVIVRLMVIFVSIIVAKGRMARGKKKVRNKK